MNAIQLYVFLDAVLPIPLILMSCWLGLRFGARATLMNPFLPIGLFRLAQWMSFRDAGIEAVMVGAEMTMWSACILFAWVAAWCFLAPRFERRFGTSHRAVLGCAFSSILLAAVLRGVTAVPVELLLADQPTWRFVIGLAVLTALFAFCLWVSDEEAPERGGGDLVNMAMRALMIVAIVRFDGWMRGMEGVWAGGLVYVLDSFPRATFEHVVGTQAALGVRAGRQVLYGLPFGLLPVVLWLAAVRLLPPLIGGLAAMQAATVISVGAWAFGVWYFLRMEKVRSSLSDFQHP